jgi:hypothetical protein
LTMRLRAIDGLQEQLDLQTPPDFKRLEAKASQHKVGNNKAYYCL